MNVDISPVQVEGIRITKLQVDNEPYSPGRRERSVEKTRLFVHIKDESVLQNFMSRVAQREDGLPPRLSPDDIRKHILPQVVEQLKEKFPDTRIKDTSQLRWSAKAGCTMCPCSPGFVVENSYNWSIWVEVEPAAVDLKPLIARCEQALGIAPAS